jgi:ADP-ribose pyrophosphatase YjhB (NUDIX family)
MNYCSHCSHPVELKIPVGDSRQRYVCCHCNRIYYDNPKVIAGCIPQWKNQILLCQRAINPRQGYWTLPAGFMELNEDVKQAAIRETFEEAQTKVNNVTLYLVMDVPHISQVHILFRAELDLPEFSAGEESEQVKLFKEEDIPWNQLAFPTIDTALKHFYRDQKQANFSVKHLLIDKIIGKE